MLEQEDLHAVVVASATSVHAEQALKAIAKGYHVLSEMPLSIDLNVVSTLLDYQRDRVVTKWLILVRSGPHCSSSVRDLSAELPGGEGPVQILSSFRRVVPQWTQPDIKRSTWAPCRVSFANRRPP